MSDETAAKAESTAQMIATVVRLSQMQNITFEDAASLLLKVSNALAKAEASMKAVS